MYKHSAVASILTPPNTPHQRLEDDDNDYDDDDDCLEISSADSGGFYADIYSDLRFPTTTDLHLRTDMSGFLSSEAERALMGEGEGAAMLFTEQADLALLPGFEARFIDEDSQWAHAHSDASGFDHFHPYPHASAEENLYSAGSQRPTTSSRPSGGPSCAGTSSDPSSSSSLRASLSALAPPPDRSRSRSRSISPHPEGLQKYGTLNADSRTWRCAFPGCHSKAVFARPCDLRKHFHRHSKSYFCRHEGCPQASHGGFSSKKDRVRHEAKHNPGIECDAPGCDRIFSRLDNMKDHLKRIHKS